MYRSLILFLALALLLLPFPVLAAEVDCDAIYCFTSTDFAQQEEVALMGVCITELPDPKTGTVFLGQRVLQKGDILTAEQTTAQDDATVVMISLESAED